HDADDVLGRVGDRQRQEADPGVLGQDTAQHLHAPTAGQVDVEKDQIGLFFRDHVHGAVDVTGLAQDFDGVTEFTAHPAAEQAVVVHDHDPGDRVSVAEGRAVRAVVFHTWSLPTRPRGPVVVPGRCPVPVVPHICGILGIRSCTSVPSPGSVRMRAPPPWRSIRPMMDPRTPMRSCGMVSRSKPTPRSRTNTKASSSSTSPNTAMVSASEYLEALTMASRAARSMALSPSSMSQSPTQTTSMGTPCSSSTSAATRSNPGRTVVSASAGRG